MVGFLLKPVLVLLRVQLKFSRKTAAREHDVASHLETLVWGLPGESRLHIKSKLVCEWLLNIKSGYNFICKFRSDGVADGIVGVFLHFLHIVPCCCMTSGHCGSRNKYRTAFGVTAAVHRQQAEKLLDIACRSEQKDATGCKTCQMWYSKTIKAAPVPQWSSLREQVATIKSFAIVMFADLVSGCRV